MTVHPIFKMLSFLVCLCPVSLFCQNNADDILGVWLNEKKEAVVQIYRDGDEFFGKIIDIRGEHAPIKGTLKDLNNPKPEFKGRPMIGMPLLENLSYKNGEYSGGTAYNPRMGRYFSCKAWLISEKEMKLRGYWGFIYGTETWEKIGKY